MADIRESFPTTENGSGVGVPLSSVVEGDAAAAKNASAALVAKDSSGNLKFILVDDAGNLLVSTDGGGTPAAAAGQVGGSGSFVTVCDIALVAGKTYRAVEWLVNCFRDALFEIVHIDDPTGTPVESVMGWIAVGPGDFTDSGSLKSLTFVAGATTPVLRLRAKNLNAVSDLRGTIACIEDAA